MKPISVVEIYTTSVVIACLLRKCIARSQQLLFEVSLLLVSFCFCTLVFLLLKIKMAYPRSKKN